MSGVHQRGEDMANSTIWWLIAGAAIVLELLSGTVYLLLLASGFAAAAVAARLGAGLAWYVVHGRRPPQPPTGSNRDLNLDIGEIIHIEAWNPDGTAAVRY